VGDRERSLGRAIAAYFKLVARHVADTGATVTLDLAEVFARIDGQ
jgi:hypothetical protein